MNSARGFFLSRLDSFEQKRKEFKRNVSHPEALQEPHYHTLYDAVTSILLVSCFLKFFPPVS
jgi:hypothetical protein